MLVSKKQLKDIQQNYRLSPQEMKIIYLLFEGAETNDEIAKKMCISRSSVCTYLRNIYFKTQTKSKLSTVLRLAEFKKE